MGCLNCCIFVLLLIHVLPVCISQCDIPEYLRGRFHSTDRSIELNTVISERSFSNEQLGDGECHEIFIIKDTTDAYNRSDLKILFYNRESKCFICQEFYLRTINIVQHRYTSCVNPKNIETENGIFDEVCEQIHPNMDTLTMFRVDIQTTNCKSTIEGCYHFTYEVDFGGGSICNSPKNIITACQRPGSVYVDNQVFDMSFGECPDVSSSVRTTIRFQCMGSWEDETGNIFSAIADIHAVHYRDRFRCLLTRNDQEIDNNKRRFSMSRWSSCAALKTPYDGDIRFILTPSKYEEIPILTAGCKFPRNFTGTFVGHHDLDSFVTINTTHILITTVLNQYDQLDSYYICLQQAETRYFTFHVDIGKCESHFVCFDFLQRRQNLIQFRQARSLPAHLKQISNIDYLTYKFREACSWSRFTYERNDGPQEWIYSTFVAYPPSPIPCPIGGRYIFTQEGLDGEIYKTEVGGMTERPRHSVDCKEMVSELKSCDDNPSKMFLDVSYCASLDHTGRPVGEYDVPDRELICVAYWMENMKSYLITYDLLDPVSDLRCWVYARTSWRDIYMSRSTSYVCDMVQSADSLGVDGSSSLRMVLKEGERLYDECPQRFDSGEGDNSIPYEIFVLDTSSSSANHKPLLRSFTLRVTIYYLL